MSKVQKVAILLFDHVEVLDFSGPFEVFSVTGRKNGSKPFNVYTVAEQSPVQARNALGIIPHYIFTDAPAPDILVIPGGGGYQSDGTAFGSRKEMHNPVLLNWIKEVYPECQNILSVCTGALLLAKAGLSKNLNATTHHMAFDSLRAADPSVTVLEDQRIVDNGKIIFSGGISAGIDASFHLVSRLLGETVALNTAKYMEYHWKPQT
ncbi:MAG: DJ-1/PfpI family protein [Gammaproteobacteria bacterium]|nr:DJ-1/PfpI family protein [Gammaproteobacteria bacterium]NNC98149.1 DJ-1/PfpI family protein [Gammaproteobacteria bacterium]NNM13680.1 DJ-1/PfpI family protein [Gammaproteobacteria bacterium]